MIIYAIDINKKDFTDKTRMIECSVESDDLKSGIKKLLNSNKSDNATHFITKENFNAPFFKESFLIKK